MASEEAGREAAENREALVHEAVNGFGRTPFKKLKLEAAVKFFGFDGAFPAIGHVAVSVDVAILASGSAERAENAVGLSLPKAQNGKQ